MGGYKGLTENRNSYKMCRSNKKLMLFDPITYYFERKDIPMKKLIALLAVLVLTLSLAATAFAADLPTATLKKASKGQTVAPGETITFKFKLDSGDYTMKKNAFRAKLVCQVVKGDATYSKATWVWTGVQNYEVSMAVRKKAPEGKYTLKYTTYYRKNANKKWQKAQANQAKFTVEND